MTACLYVSPPFDVGDPEGSVLAALAADIMVTQTVYDRSGNKIDRRAARTPATSRAMSFDDPVNTLLFRKLNIIGPCAIACASNDGARVYDVVRRVKQDLSSWIAEGEDRPLKELGKLLTMGNEEQARRGRPMVQGLAACRAPDDKINRVHSSKGINLRLRHFGWTHAIGSGAQTLINMVTAFEQSIDNMMPDNIHPLSKIEGLMKYINGCKIAEEMKFGPQEGWGGYLEWAILQPGSGCWQRGGPTVYVTSFVAPTENGEGGIKVPDVIICYDPNILGGCVFSLTDDGILIYPLEYMIGNPPPAESFFAEFKGWKPESCVVTAASSLGPRGPNWQHYCLWEDADFIHLEVKEDHVELGLNFTEEMMIQQRDAMRQLIGEKVLRKV